MRVLVAPDAYAGTLSAPEAAEAIADGWRRTAADDDLELVPLSDGGPGFLEVVHAGLGGDLVDVDVHGTLGRSVAAQFLLVRRAEQQQADGGPPMTGYVESASAAGLQLVDPAERDPLAATSYGVGELIAAAVHAGAEHVVVGVGGTASTDGGVGMITALAGGQPGDDADPEAARQRLQSVRLTAATDVDAVLLGHEGAAHGFAAQKGADRAGRDLLETRLRTWATATEGRLAVQAGAGAGGGIGFGLLLLGASRVPGAQLALDVVRLVDRARRADLLVTGEGALDWQSLRGKVVTGVARTGQDTGRPTVVLAGRVEVGQRERSSTGIDAAYAVADLAAGERGKTPYDDLAALAARAARTWSPRRRVQPG